MDFVSTFYILFYCLSIQLIIFSPAITDPPLILASPNCNKTADQVSCSCETEGNPSPSVHWYLNGLPVSQSDQFKVSTRTLTDKHLRSVITVNQPQERNLSSLLCRSFNSLGSANLQFCANNLQTSAEGQGLYYVPL